MHYCLYASSASKPLLDRDLMDIKQQLRTDSENFSLTGLLVFHRNTFIHYYEGEAGALEKMLSALKKDKRLAGLNAISKGELTERQFPNCTMELRVLDKDPLFSADDLDNDKVGIKQQINDYYLKIT